jgi:hypothetical protein
MAMAMCTRLVKFYDIGVPRALPLPQHHPDNFPFQRMPQALHERLTFAIPEGCNVYHTEQASDPKIDNRR